MDNDKSLGLLRNTVDVGRSQGDQLYHGHRRLVFWDRPLQSALPVWLLTNDRECSARRQDLEIPHGSYLGRRR